MSERFAFFIIALQCLLLFRQITGSVIVTFCIRDQPEAGTQILLVVQIKACVLRLCGTRTIEHDLYKTMRANCPQAHARLFAGEVFDEGFEFVVDELD